MSRHNVNFCKPKTSLSWTGEIQVQAECTQASRDLGPNRPKTGTYSMEKKLSPTKTQIASLPAPTISLKPGATPAERKRVETATAFLQATNDKHTPITTLLTITAGPLAHSYREDIRGLTEIERLIRLKNGLQKKLERLLGHMPCVLWSLDDGPVHGLHIHFAIAMPREKLRALSEWLAASSGTQATQSTSSALWAPLERTRSSNSTYRRSECGAWQIDLNNRGANGACRLTEYIVQQPSKRSTSASSLPRKCFGTWGV